ncbi:MAG: helix-turn-helix domain-containing protein [Bacteroidetes bacterium]|nr:helix-turn-helix domain-containing protein [Bacteroidota bacterium]
MKEVYSTTGEYLLGLQDSSENPLDTSTQFSEYTIIHVTAGSGIYHADFGAFPFQAPALLFSTPLQHIYIEPEAPLHFTLLRFHGDFYCIEYHRSEVACNGLLFNNIYLQPVVPLTKEETGNFKQLIGQLHKEINDKTPSEIVLRSYLQLLLAKSSSIKTRQLAAPAAIAEKDEQMEQFRTLLDQHFLTLHKPNDYAKLLVMTPNNLTKRSVRYFKKTPSQLIQERLILEAKKKLHLTRQSIKGIAYALNFQDEFYFSRVFKKLTKVSPQAFRDKTGISIVADLSK